MPRKARQMQHGDGESSRSYSLVPDVGGGVGVAAAISRRCGELSAWPQQGGRGPWVGVWGRWPRWRNPGPEMGPLHWSPRSQVPCPTSALGTDCSLEACYLPSL